MARSTAKVLDLSYKPKGIILSGGPYAIYEKDAPKLDPAVFELNVPVLGICYGLQAIAWHFANVGAVVAGEEREYGEAHVSIKQHKESAVHVDRLFAGLGDQIQVWMSHGKSSFDEFLLSLS